MLPRYDHFGFRVAASCTPILTILARCAMYYIMIPPLYRPSACTPIRSENRGIVRHITNCKIIMFCFLDNGSKCVYQICIFKTHNKNITVYRDFHLNLFTKSYCIFFQYVPELVLKGFKHCSCQLTL